MTPLLENSLAQTKKYRSLLKNFVGQMVFDWTPSMRHESTEIRPNFIKQTISRIEINICKKLIESNSLNYSMLQLLVSADFRPNPHAHRTYYGSVRRTHPHPSSCARTRTRIFFLKKYQIFLYFLKILKIYAHF